MLHLPHSGSTLFELFERAPETLLNQSLSDQAFSSTQKLEIFYNFQWVFFFFYQELRNTEPCENE